MSHARFETIVGVVVPIDRSNIDTDAIIPKQFMKSIRQTGFGDNLFDEWRYRDYGEPGEDCAARPLNSDFSLNQLRFQGASILLARKNFGCGSSREHAVWALRDFGIRVLIAPSFSDIFYNNCLNNGLLPIVLSEDAVSNLFIKIERSLDYQLLVDLPRQVIETPSHQVLSFDIAPSFKHRLINGLDQIQLTLQHADEIVRYQKFRKQVEPWLFDSIND